MKRSLGVGADVVVGVETNIVLILKVNVSRSIVQH